MQHRIFRTALPGRSRSSHDQLAKSLGYFSLALGVAELIVPRLICRTAGMRPNEVLVRSYGARELATGVAIATTHDATPYVWARVAGDVADIATVAAARRRIGPGFVLAMLALAGVTAVDTFCALGLSSEKGRRSTARAQFSSRSGFPKGVEAARGAARDFAVPRDFRTPPALRPYAGVAARAS